MPINRNQPYNDQMNHPMEHHRQTDAVFSEALDGITTMLREVRQDVKNLTNDVNAERMNTAAKVGDVEKNMAVVMNRLGTLESRADSASRWIMGVAAALVMSIVGWIINWAQALSSHAK